MKFDHNILFEFLPEKDKKNFLVWDNAYRSSGGVNIVAVYRAPFEERLVIPLSLYNERVEQKEREIKQKEREIKLNTIL